MIETPFELDPRLAADGQTLLDLPLNRVLLVNNQLFPWMILIPRKNNLKEITDLNPLERSALMEEISLTCEIMTQVFIPHKLNIAALGNVVPQLHIHIVARYQQDAAWPQPVFGQQKQPYAFDAYQKQHGILTEAFKKHSQPQN